MSTVSVLMCPSCNASYPGTTDFCVHWESGKPNIMSCLICCHSWVHDSRSAIYKEIDLTDSSESDSETGIELGINELKRTIAKQESRIKFMHLPQFDTDRGCGGLKGDVVIVVEGRAEEPLHAHKFILSSKSPVFCKMFETEMLEGETGIVRIDDATLPVMRAMLKFCYSAEINFSREVSAEDILKVAHKFAIEYLQEICEEHLITTINKRNLPRRLNLAMRLSAMKLKIAATEYLKKHFDILISEVFNEFRSP